MKKALSIIVILLCVSVVTKAQCPYTNTAFKAGESLQCNFYFNWKFVWVKAGGARLTVTNTTYHGNPALKMRLVSSTNKAADAFFKMRDTLETVFTPDLVPLYYRKGSLEGDRYFVDEVFYSYANGKTIVHQRRVRYNGEIVITDDTVPYCVYDMMSLLARARSFNFYLLKKGTVMNFKVANGSEIDNQKLIYRGVKVIKSDEDQKRYRCLVISLVTHKNGKERELITFYVSDDMNHLPILLDLNLNFGSAKALLTTTVGNRYPMSSVVNK